MNKEKEMIEKNIELSAEFSRYLFEHPEIETKIPVDAEIILLPEFDLELKEFNLKLGKIIEAEGGRVVKDRENRTGSSGLEEKVCWMSKIEV